MRPFLREGERGSCGGYPAKFFKARYRARNSVERAAIKTGKQFGAVATPYDKRGYAGLGT